MTPDLWALAVVVGIALFILGALVLGLSTNDRAEPFGEPPNLPPLPPKPRGPRHLRRAGRHRPVAIGA